MQRTSSNRAFTFLEILAVLVLMTVVLGFAIGSVRVFGNKLRSESQNIVQMLQAAYFQSLKQGKVFRVHFPEDGASLRVERFQLPAPPPPKEDEDAYREWEKLQEEKNKALRDLSSEERRRVGLLQRGDFELIRERELGGGIRVSRILHRQAENTGRNILIFPTGEIQSVLIVVEDEDGNAFSLTTNPVTGRVEAQKGLISEEDWSRGPQNE